VVMLPLTLPFMQDDRFIAQYITLQIDHRIAAKLVWGLTDDFCLFSPEPWLHDKPLSGKLFCPTMLLSWYVFPSKYKLVSTCEFVTV